MFLHKIKSGESGILTYGITPPKEGTDLEKITQIAEKTVARLLPLDIDALIVYDVQDESARTSEERPFPFLNALDPFYFASEFLQQIQTPKIIYRPAGKFSEGELSEWLDKLHQHQFYPVFVGVPAPDYPVKTTLPQAYKLWNRYSQTSAIGAVTIPERHEKLKDEDIRILDKANHGVSYFISQCIFNLDYAKNVVNDLHATCVKEKRKIPTIIFTLTACGSAKTLHFLEWLGIHVPEELKIELRQSENILEKSVNSCLEIAEKLAIFCAERSIPFGFNIESVAIRKEEIEASIYMVNRIAGMLSEMGIRKEILTPESAIQ
ncbi:hypothetical protein DVR12_02705 [Chitinophaga silvatica]|uniref:Methylenetetrahydrofolate reductase (NAD(P)H) n=1 Tax=Chitinophaga silvatica TaxID=2282649 RepID=A0A3E1YH63_9BACT|nr:hypothetical protein [Chitinophaga silvatica]RFS26716.1 hypothetical protein DVR12_02705 [Chitinophaga silvatica]